MNKPVKYAMLGFLLGLPITALAFVITNMSYQSFRQTDFPYDIFGFRVTKIHAEYFFMLGTTFLFSLSLIIWPRLGNLAQDQGLSNILGSLLSGNYTNQLLKNSGLILIYSIVVVGAFFLWNTQIFDHSRHSIAIFEFDRAIVILASVANIFANLLWREYWPTLFARFPYHRFWFLSFLIGFILIYLFRFSFAWLGNLEDLSIAIPLAVYVVHIIFLAAIPDKLQSPSNVN